MIYNVCTYQNIVDFLLKSQIPVSKIYISPSQRKVWNTNYRVDFDRNPEIQFSKIAINVIRPPLVTKSSGLREPSSQWKRHVISRLCWACSSIRLLHFETSTRSSFQVNFSFLCPPENRTPEVYWCIRIYRKKTLFSAACSVTSNFSSTLNHFQSSTCVYMFIQVTNEADFH